MGLTGLCYGKVRSCMRGIKEQKRHNSNQTALAERLVCRALQALIHLLQLCAKQSIKNVLNLIKTIKKWQDKKVLLN